MHISRILFRTATILPFFISAAFCSDSDLQVRSRVSEVTVYSDRALVTRNAEVDLQTGERTVVFSGLPSSIDPASIQVTGSGGAVLKDVKVNQKNYTQAPDSLLNPLQKQKQFVEDSIQTINDLITAAGKEKEFLDNIAKKVTSIDQKKSSGEIGPEQWIKMVDFYASRLKTVDNNLRDLQKSNRGLQARLDKIQKDIYDLGKPEGMSTYEVKLDIFAKKSEQVSINCSYIVYGPSWYPLYDLRASSNEKTLNVTGYAVVSQNTNENWENVKVRISTARPSISGTQPELQPWFVSFYEPHYDKAEVMSLSKRSMGVQEEKRKFEADNVAGYLDNPAPASMPAPQVNVETGATSVVYQIDGKYTINADNQEHKVSLINKDLPAEFSYSTVPKLTPYAYLKAEVKNESEFSLLPGRSNIYLDNSFVTSSDFSLVAPGEKFKTSLGIDEGMQVKYKLMKKYYQNEGIIAKKERVIYEYQIVVTNKKKSAQNIVISDQIPMSTTEDIIVTLLQPSKDAQGVKISKEKFIEWNRKIAPGEIVTLPLSFSVEYPKGSTISGLE
jgi:uncharacterized protein (TIGR02231 family)